MKNVFVYLDFIELCGLDEAICHYEKGDNVIILCCDEVIGLCLNNPHCNSLKCGFCKRVRRQTIQKYFPNSENIYFFSELVENEFLKESATFRLDYDSVNDLKSIVFHGVEIGYGAFSSYVSLTRICTPELNDETKKYMDYIMRREIISILTVESLFNKIKPDLVYFHNGRFAQHKPIYGVAKNRGIDFVCLEQGRTADGRCFKDYTYNNVVHNVDAFTKKMFDNWNAGDKLEREALGESFYLNRSKGVFAGDKVYVSGQSKGLLPSNWDSTKENIIIFNSSDDEYISISKEFDEGRVFPTQYEGLKAIFEHYKNDENKHFYVRVHPNLANVKDISHTSLYALKYDNATIIPPNSPISSYTLLEEATKVVVFQSTIGAEAAFGDKPVITLDLSQYERLGFTYQPKTPEQLFELIDTKNLSSKKNHNVIKYGYAFMKRNNSGSLRFEDVQLPFKLFGVFPYYYNKALTFYGSAKLFSIINAVLNWNSKSIGFFTKFRVIPSKTKEWILETKDY